MCVRASVQALRDGLMDLSETHIYYSIVSRDDARCFRMLNFSKMADWQPFSEIWKILNISLNSVLLELEFWFVLTLNRKSWSRNPLVKLYLTSDLSLKVIGDFQGQSYTKHSISALLLRVETRPV